MQSIDYNEGKLFYESRGNGEAILFVHGFSLDHRMWQPQIEHFRNRFQTITYDLRGFGKSSLPKGEYSHHKDMKALLDFLGIQSVHLVGLSLGGEMSINFNLTYPNQVNTLTLIDTSLDGFASKVDWRVFAKEEGLEKARQNWLNHQVFKPSCKNDAVKEKLSQMVHDYSGWHWLHEDPSNEFYPSAMERLGEITNPTQIIVGEKDLDYYHQIARVIKKKIKRATLDILPATGHMANLEKPDEVNTLIHKNINS